MLYSFQRAFYYYFFIIFGGERGGGKGKKNFFIVPIGLLGKGIMGILGSATFMRGVWRERQGERKEVTERKTRDERE